MSSGVILGDSVGHINIDIDMISTNVVVTRLDATCLRSSVSTTRLRHWLSGEPGNIPASCRGD